MRRNLVKNMAVLLLLTGCAGQSNYEKAIADFVQTDKRGTWTDLQFKVIEMGEPTDITVKDSIAILTEKFDAEKSKRLAMLNESIARNKKSMENERFNSMKEFYQKLIDKNQVLVDSLMKTSVELPDAYKNAAETTVLAKKLLVSFPLPIQCLTMPNKKSRRILYSMLPEISVTDGTVRKNNFSDI